MPFMKTACIIGILALPMASWCADVAKLRHSFSVYVDESGASLRRPEGVACNERSLIIADTENDRLLRYAFEETALKGGSEIKIPQLSYPIHVQIDPKGDILALDGKQRRIVRLSADGAFKGYVIPQGAPAPSVIIPRSFKVGADGTIYILDIFSRRVLAVSADGKYQRQIEFRGEHGFFSDVTVDARGTVLVIDSVKGRLLTAAQNAATFSPLGDSLKEHLNFPGNLTTDSRGTIYITDLNGGAVGILSQDGAFLGKQLGMGWNEGLLSYPSQACINGKGEIFIADRGNSRIQVFIVTK